MKVTKTDLLRGDKHLHHEVLHAPRRKWRVRRVPGSLVPDHLPTHVRCKEVEGQKILHEPVRAQKLANSAKDAHKNK